MSQSSPSSDSPEPMDAIHPENDNHREEDDRESFLNLPDPTDDLDRDVEAMGWNQLSRLGNHAIQLGLIIGHGFYKGQYEILKSGESMLMSPDEALTYLQTLVREQD